MNGPFVVAQAGSKANSGADPVQIIKLTKPQAGHTDIFHASFTGTVKIDFTAIANEKITLFHDSKNQSLHVIFADGSQDIIEPFFDSRGTILSNLILEMGPNVTMGGEQFAQQFTITEDQSVLPAAGPGGVTSGADFHDPSVDPLALGNPLDLLPPEELPNINFTVEEAPTFIQAANQTPTVFGHVFGVVEEEQLNQQIIEELKLHGINTDAGNGNEDTHDAAGGPGFADGAGNDKDTTNFPPGSLNTTQFFNGTLAGLVVGGDLPITFLTNSAANGTTVHDSNGNDLKSIGETVQYLVIDSTTIEGVTPGGEGADSRVIFILHVNADGTFTFELTDQIDHPIHSHDDGTNPQGIFEETLNIDLSSAIFAHDATPDPISFPAHTLEIGVIDDTPIAFDSVPNYPQPYYDGEGGSGSYSQALDDENQHHGIQGGPGDDGFGKKLTGVLDFSPGADNYGGVSFGTNLDVVVTDGENTLPVSQLQAIWVDGSGVGHKEDVDVAWTADGNGGGTLHGTMSTPDGTKDVFTLTVDKFGDYTFCLNAPLAHTFTADPNSYGNQTEFEDNLQIKFTYTATDLDGDQADAHLTINVDDDVPTLCIDTFQGEGSGSVVLGVVHDETPGTANTAQNPEPPANDVSGSTAITFNGNPTTIAALFNGIPNTGDDPDVSGHGAIGYAQGLNGLVNVHANFGADGAALNQAEVFSLNLSQGNGEWSGLYTTEGEKIYLYKQTINGNDVIVGRIDADHDLAEDSQPGHFDHFDSHDSDDAAAFAITIDPATGKVYLVQYLSLEHFSSPDAGGDISEPVTLASGTLSVSVTLTDGDGDSVTKTADVGPEIKFLDDGPKVSVSVDRHFSVVLDETPGVQFEDDDTTSSTVRHLFDSVSNKGNDPDVSSGDKDHGALGFAISTGEALDVNAVFGADGPKLDNHGHPDGTAFSLALSSEGVYSGIDTTDGTHIYLFTENGIIVGRVGSSEGAAAFAVTIDDNGNVATAEWLSLHHNSADNGDIDETVQLASGTINAIVTITDGDGDTASASADISGKVQFEDDGPSAKSNDIVVLEDDDLAMPPATAPGIEGGPGDDIAPQNTTGFLGHDYGADGPGGISLLGVNLPGGLGFTISASSATAITIAQNGIDVLQINLTNTTTGAYSVTQLHAIDHPGHDDPFQFGTQTSYEDNLDFTVNYRVTDGDGDHTDGSMKITVDDDSPDPHVTLASGTIIHDETPGVDGDANDVTPTATLDTLFTAVTNKANDPDVTDLVGEDPVIGYAQVNAGAIVTVDPRYGADGPGSVVYGFDLNGSHPSTGLQTTDGRNISLFQVNSHLVVGRYEVGGNNDPDGSTVGGVSDEPAAFAINIDPATGQITVVQYQSIKHDDRGDSDEANDNGNNVNDAPPNDPLTVQQWITDNALQLTVTVTDHDGDAVTDSVNIGHKIIFQDDGPTVSDSPKTEPNTSGLSLDLDETLVVTDHYNGGEPESGGGPSNGNTDDHGPLTVTVTTAPLANNSQAIGELTTGLSGGLGSLFNVTVNFGADGPAASGSRVDTLSLVLSGDAKTSLAVTALANSPALSGLDLAHRAISLVQVDSTHIEGRIPGADGLLGSGGDDYVAFRITLLNPDNPATAQIQVDQFLPIDHGSDGNHFDTQALLTLVNGGTLGLHIVTTLTDGDGDPATSSATVNLVSSGSSFISFDDDGPSITSAVSTGTVIHDETPGIQTAADPNPANDVASSGLPTGVLALFDAVTNKGVDPDVAVKDHDAIGFATSSSPIVIVSADFGTDGPAISNSKVFSLVVNGTNGADSGLQTTDGHEIFLFQEGSLIVGRYDGNNSITVTDGLNNSTHLPNGTFVDPAAFAIAIGQDGNISVAQYVSLKNPIPGTTDAAHDEPTTGLKNVQVAVTITDGDGDHVTRTVDVSGNIVFQDDAPQPFISATSGTLIIDETAGQDAGTNDVATTPGLLALFSELLLGTPIQIAQSGAALFTTASPNFGADGPGAGPNTSFGLNVTDGTDSGLNATDGRSIYLYHSGNLIVGREGDIGTDAANAGGPIAFALSIDSGTGTVTIAEYIAIQHPNPLDPNEAGAPQTIVNDALQVTFSLTDGDNDTTTASAGIGNLIQFRDDGPSIAPNSNLIVNSSFEEGHPNLSGADWDIYASLPGWTYGIDHIPFEVQTGGAGGLAAEDGFALVELDGDTAGNPSHQPPSATPDPVHTDATIQQVIAGTEAGQTYELTFWYSPRPGNSAGDDSGLNVLWNGAIVDTIDSTGLASGWQQIVLFVTGTGPGDTLGFQGTGPENELGAFIDNVTLVAATVVDEDGLPTGNHDIQPGDIIVPNADGDNNEATSTGLLDINWGADNFDTAADTHVSGNPALGFVQDSGGRSVTFTNTTVGITGGTLTSHGDAITLTLSPDHTVLTGTAQHGEDPARTVFEVSLSDDGSGAFRFILEDGLDQSNDGSKETNIALSFNFTATDSDGDTSAGTFQVLVNDDIQTLKGTDANDTIVAGTGDETFIGGLGSDTLTGNAGNDHFQYNATNEGLDHIVDFGTGNDVLDFNHLAFGGGLAVGGADTGTLDPTHFVANGTGPTNANQKFWYNTTDHTVYFDADGAGAGSPIAMAKLENSHALASNEIHVV